MFVQYWVNMWTQRKADEQNYVGPTQSSTIPTQIQQKLKTKSQRLANRLVQRWADTWAVGLMNLFTLG